MTGIDQRAVASTRCAARPCKTACGPLRLAGALRVAEGLTTLEEVIAATPAARRSRVRHRRFRNRAITGALRM